MRDLKHGTAHWHVSTEPLLALVMTLVMAAGGGRLGRRGLPSSHHAMHIMCQGQESNAKSQESFAVCTRKDVVCECRYVSLFPLLMGLLDASSPELGQQLKLLQRPDLLWTPYGLRYWTTPLTPPPLKPLALFSA